MKGSSCSSEAELLSRPLGQLLVEAPFLRDFFEAHELPEPDSSRSFQDFVSELPPRTLEAGGWCGEDLKQAFAAFWQQMRGVLDEATPLSSLEILGGRDKRGGPETLNVRLEPGDVLSIVGPTGAGKSRLLEDIECLAQGDTPTRRHVLIDGREVDADQRFGVDQRPVAQLSQNMNFVLDVSVEEFVALHAESRMLSDVDGVVEAVYEMALLLAGEPFDRTASVTTLSGGQSRALMIADTARLSRSPIVLIDEIENAGVDRRRALELLVSQEKIVLLVTHDPELALYASRRLLIRDGGMRSLIERSDEEERTLQRLRQYSARVEAMRSEMRKGCRLLW